MLLREVAANGFELQPAKTSKVPTKKMSQTPQNHRTNHSTNEIITQLA